MIVNKLNVPMYNYDIIVCFNYVKKNYDAAEQILDKYQVDDDEVDSWLDDAKGWTLQGKTNTVIFINTYLHRKKIDLLTTIRHEIHHGSANCFEYIGNPITILDEEAYLYLNDWIFTKVLEMLEKNRDTIIKHVKDL
jgi:hypothetical protein